MNKENTIKDIQNKTIFTAVKTIVETITLDYYENPEGFKLFYDVDTLEPLHGIYWHETLNPYTHKEIRLTPDEFDQVIEWRDK